MHQIVSDFEFTSLNDLLPIPKTSEHRLFRSGWQAESEVDVPFFLEK